VVGNVASIMVDNLNFVPNNVKNLLFKLADSSDTATDVLKTVIGNFDKIPANFRTDLIIRAASHVGNDPKLAGLAEMLIRNSPEIAATVIGCIQVRFGYIWKLTANSTPVGCIPVQYSIILLQKSIRSNIR
jgi:hypothetical protein